MNHLFDVLLSTAASTVRGWRGTSGSKAVQLPQRALMLFDREDDAECRLVREALTELNLDVSIIPCPTKGNRFANDLYALSGGKQVPYLYDPNIDFGSRGSRQIIEYLFLQYRGIPAPAAMLPSLSGMLRAGLASAVRLTGKLDAVASREPEEPLVLYSFESSPFARLVRERLCQLELPYRLINLGKQQWADMGPAAMRIKPGKYKPLPNSKRDEFLKKYGKVQVPFLIDPNTGVEMFESADIVSYLDHTYGR
ncbi:MAG: glutathione S-transferase N-terminal domain-containing protein [Chitinivorax sp.]